ncbi:MAG: hypothetical protein IPL31_00070 [Saprospiraceae bacterium]|nr:hypothetical protein [Saprospiraceae bacterium]
MLKNINTDSIGTVLESEKKEDSKSSNFLFDEDFPKLSHDKVNSVIANMVKNGVKVPKTKEDTSNMIINYLSIKSMSFAGIFLQKDLYEKNLIPNYGGLKWYTGKLLVKTFSNENNLDSCNYNIYREKQDEFYYKKYLIRLYSEEQNYENELYFNSAIRKESKKIREFDEWSNLLNLKISHPVVFFDSFLNAQNVFQRDKIHKYNFNTPDTFKLCQFHDEKYSRFLDRLTKECPNIVYNIPKVFDCSSVKIFGGFNKLKATNSEGIIYYENASINVHPASEVIIDKIDTFYKHSSTLNLYGSDEDLCETKNLSLTGRVFVNGLNVKFIYYSDLKMNAFLNLIGILITASILGFIKRKKY